MPMIIRFIAFLGVYIALPFESKTQLHVWSRDFQRLAAERLQTPAINSVLHSLHVLGTTFKHRADYCDQ